MPNSVITKKLLHATYEQRLADIQACTGSENDDVLGLREALTLAVNHRHTAVTMHYEGYPGEAIYKRRDAAYTRNADSRDINRQIVSHFLSIPALREQLSAAPGLIKEIVSENYRASVSPFEEAVRRDRIDCINIFLKSIPYALAQTDVLLISLQEGRTSIFELLLGSSFVMQNYTAVARALAYASTHVEEVSSKLMGQILEKIPEKERQLLLSFALAILNDTTEMTFGKSIGISTLESAKRQHSMLRFAMRT